MGKIRVQINKKLKRGVIIGDLDADGVLDRIVFFKRKRGRGFVGNISLSSLMKRKPLIGGIRRGKKAGKIFGRAKKK